MDKEIEYAIRILTESIGEGGFINKGTPMYIACKTALASINALEEIRQEAVDAIEDGLYVRNTRILDIIDRHFRLREVKKNDVFHTY